MPVKLKIYLGTVYTVFLLFFIYLFFYHSTPLFLSEVVFFTAVLLILSNLSQFVMGFEDITSSMVLPVLLPAVVVLPPFWVGVICLMGTIHFLNKKAHVWFKFLFNRAQMFLASGLGALTFTGINALFAADNYFLPFFLACVVYYITNNGLLYLVLKFSRSGQKRIQIEYFLEISKNVFISYFIGLGFYFGYSAFGRIFIILGIMFVYIIKDLLYSRFQQIKSLTQIIESFLKVIDSKDQYTEGHCQRVAEYADILCSQLKIRSGQRQKIIQMAKIHDIGKIKVEDRVLKKPDLLTDEEYEEMKKHSVFGFEILEDIELIEKALPIIYHHHEHYDGSGYPDGLSGEDIPLGARILNICDAFDVMTTGRSYKKPRSKEEIITEINQNAGAQFDPELAAKMVKLIKDGEYDLAFNRPVRKKQTALRESLHQQEGG